MKRIIALVCVIAVFSGLFAGVQETDELWKKFRKIKKNNRNWQPGMVTTKQVTKNKKGAIQNDLEIVVKYKETDLGIESEFIWGISDGDSLDKDNPIVDAFLTQYSGKEDDDSEGSISDRKDLHLEQTSKRKKISGFNCIGYDFSYEDMVDMSKDKSGTKMKKMKMAGTFWLDEKSGAMIKQESSFAKAPSRMIKDMHNTMLFDYNEKGEWKPIEVNIDIKISVMLMTALSNTRIVMSDYFKKKNL